VTSNFPAHSSTNIPTSSSIVLQFSKPMDTNSVQSAFSINPPVNGSFSWSSANDTLTFIPGSAGLAGLTNIYVRITNSAFDAVSGNKMFATYELMFKTAATTTHNINPSTASSPVPTIP
jgi:hypothetical protein